MAKKRRMAERQTENQMIRGGWADEWWEEGAEKRRMNLEHQMPMRNVRRRRYKRPACQCVGGRQSSPFALGLTLWSPTHESHILAAICYTIVYLRLGPFVPFHLLSNYGVVPGKLAPPCLNLLLLSFQVLYFPIFETRRVDCRTTVCWHGLPLIPTFRPGNAKLQT